MCVACPVKMSAAIDRAIDESQLPPKAQQILKTHFKNQKAALCKQEWEWFGKSYDVILTNGDKLEFDSSGNCTEVECKLSQVPAAMVPASIVNKVKELFPTEKIIKMEFERTKYEVKLSNKKELTFNKNFLLLDID